MRPVRNCVNCGDLTSVLLRAMSTGPNSVHSSQCHSHAPSIDGSPSSAGPSDRTPRRRLRSRVRQEGGSSCSCFEKRTRGEEHGFPSQGFFTVLLSSPDPGLPEGGDRPVPSAPGGDRGPLLARARVAAWRHWNRAPGTGSRTVTLGAGDIRSSMVAEANRPNPPIGCPHVPRMLTQSLSMMLTVADEFAPSVATETLLNVTVNDSEGSTVASSVMAILIVRLPERPSGQVNVPLAGV